jgi:hypothetical protein
MGAIQPKANPLQLELFPPVLLDDPDAARLALQRRLNRLAGGRVRTLSLTDNRRTILSVKPARPGDRTQLDLRLHQSFLSAPDHVVAAVSAFAESRRDSERAREALAVIREHFSRHCGPGRRPVLRPAGETVDLREVVASLNDRYFEGRVAVNVTWGRSSGGAAHHSRRRPRVTSLQLGSYSFEDGLIRIHRVLDDPKIPRYVLEAVVFHEMLHADMPPEVKNGRRCFHSPEFRRRERRFRQLDKADRWIQEHLGELLAARRARRAR